ncbi:MAG: hypothetical protein M1817_001646 [Caeruleum heppii]|nr:MAG: hypothetical protein M1817_001646 [Caeruleum heppii]
MYNTNTDILVAGAFAAFTVDLLVYPLDTLKTRLQSPDYHRIYTRPLRDGVAVVDKKLLFRGLYQGVGSVIVATLPSSGAFFTTYEASKTVLDRLNARLAPHGLLLPTPLLHATASAVAELVSCVILTPAEVLKQNAQMVQSSSVSKTSQTPPTTSATLRTLTHFRAHPTRLWAGYSALALRNLPFTALQFPLFEHLRQRIIAGRQRTQRFSGTILERGTVTAVAAGSAGALAAVLTTPIDVVKTRIMLAAGSSSSFSSSSSTSSTSSSRSALGISSLTLGRRILRDEGMRALWRGGALRGVWTALGSGLYLGVYESGRVWLGRRREGREGMEGEGVV